MTGDICALLPGARHGGLSTVGNPGGAGSGSGGGGVLVRQSEQFPGAPPRGPGGSHGRTTALGWGTPPCRTSGESEEPSVRNWAYGRRIGPGQRRRIQQLFFFFTTTTFCGEVFFAADPGGVFGVRHKV